jgi:hypothetical protein
VTVSDAVFARMSYHDLRVLAVKLGVLVQDNPPLDVLQSRIRHCQAV